VLFLVSLLFPNLKPKLLLQVGLSSYHFLINSVTSFPTQEVDWINAGLLLQKLRSQGITLPLTDALIAVIAQRYQVKVLTIDKYFHHLAVELYV
jgi:hypothetical protein